jgi:hypothetical protein
MTKEGRPEEENEQNKPKFRLVDKRRINVDEVEASEEQEKSPLKPAEKAETGKSEDIKAEPKDHHPEKEPAPDIPPEFQPPPGMEVSAEEEEIGSGDDPLTYRNIAISVLQTLATVVIVDLGLVPHPQTNLVAKKIEEARKTIDLFELVLNAVRDDLPQQLVMEFDRALKDLKVNYVNQL